MIGKLALVAGLVFARAALAQISQLEVASAWTRDNPARPQWGCTYDPPDVLSRVRTLRRVGRCGPGLGSAFGAVFLTIRTPTPDRLVSVSSPVAKKAELHTMSMEGMVMKTHPLAG